MTSHTLSISDLARRTEVSTHTLRYYESLGLIPQVERSASSGHRRYSERHIQWIRFLRRLRSAGMPIAKVRQYVAWLNAGDPEPEKRLALLAAHREEVAETIAELRRHLEILDRKLATGCGPRQEADA